jgi:pyruvate/2-oxoglutarate/acetoin dehydrogenase E1 component
VAGATGLALRGYRPVCEIQFDGFVYPAFDQIVSQLATMRARFGGLLSLPVVIRIPVGGGALNAIRDRDPERSTALRGPCATSP